MVIREELNAALEKMILSASGWRGVFAENSNEESSLPQISPAHRIICASAAYVFAEYLKNRGQGLGIRAEVLKPTVLLGTDTRPTGKAIADAMIPVLLACGCEVKYAGVTAAPEIMAWARKHEPVRTEEKTESSCGFIYVSASHNPIGHNGLKFGLTDGGVLAAEEVNKLITSFRVFIENEDNISFIKSIIFTTNSNLRFAHDHTNFDCSSDLSTGSCGLWLFKKEAFKAYYDFCGEVVWGGSDEISSAVKDGLKQQGLGIVCDFNGSARTVSIDKDFFDALGFKFEYINGEPGQIAHRIVPEGESLEPCAALLEEIHKRDEVFVLGYMPDCDGDRGNLVIWDDKINRARTLEAQEVFALTCVAEFSQLVWTGELSGKAAVVVNDPTSMRIERIAEAFGLSVFRAEVGEANVVSLARKLRKDGYIVRILGEGSAGGNITHPSAVRDPLHTVLAIAKLLSVRSTNEKPGLFEIWCKLSKQEKKYRSDFTLADIIVSLPLFVTTGAYSKDAVLRINTNDHVSLKERYQQLFEVQWEERKEELKKRFGIYSWEAIAYNGMVEKRRLENFGEAHKGGLKILFFSDKGRGIAYIWMRGSATEPVFRIIVDVEGADTGFERYLLDWQRSMIINADKE